MVRKALTAHLRSLGMSTDMLSGFWEKMESSRRTAIKVMTQSPELDRALVDSSNWADKPSAQGQLTRLCANAPLQPLSLEGFEPFWNVSRYNDIEAFEDNRQVFIFRLKAGPVGSFQSPVMAWQRPRSADSLHSNNNIIHKTPAAKKDLSCA